MNYWARYLAALPPTLQRLIASTQRVSLPRNAPAPLRLARLRSAICRPEAVRSTFAQLDADTHDALHQLRQQPRGLSSADLAARFGPIRPLYELWRDRAPRSRSEQLLLLGWLLPRTSMRGTRATRYLLPPELRSWLPEPLDCSDAAPLSACLPLALRAATAILTFAAVEPLLLRRNGWPVAVSLRMLFPRLTPLAEDEAQALLIWLCPLLADLGLLVAHGAAARTGPSALRFLAAPPAKRLDMLTDAWVRAAHTEPWLTPLRVNLQGLDWPVLRRRLLVWAAHARENPAADYERLSSALGPLADTTTHALSAQRRRAPWSSRRAAAVWAAASAGPLSWLGLVPSGMTTAPAEAASPWLLSADGMLRLLDGVAEADQLRLAPFVAFVQRSEAATVYRLDQHTLATACAQGADPALLRTLLARHHLALPERLAHLLRPDGGMRMQTQTLLLSDRPADLTTALRRSAVRRAVTLQPAPGVAIVAPGAEVALARALARTGRVVVAPSPAPQPQPLAELNQHERAALLLAARFYQLLAPADAPPGPGLDLLDRLRVGVAPELLAAQEAALTALLEPAAVEQAHPVERPTLPAHQHREELPALASLIEQLRDALRRRALLLLHYQGLTDQQPRERLIRPLRLERHGLWWYLHAYAPQLHAERCFRLDRVRALLPFTEGQTTATTTPPARRSRRAPLRPRSTPQTGFFAAPPTPPAVTNLVKVWLEE